MANWIVRNVVRLSSAFQLKTLEMLGLGWRGCSRPTYEVFALRRTNYVALVSAIVRLAEPTGIGLPAPALVPLGERRERFPSLSKPTVSTQFILAFVVLLRTSIGQVVASTAPKDRLPGGEMELPGLPPTLADEPDPGTAKMGTSAGERDRLPTSHKRIPIEVENLWRNVDSPPATRCDFNLELAHTVGGI